MIGLSSSGIAKIKFLDKLLNSEFCLVGRYSSPPVVDAVAGWGRKRSGRKAQLLARRQEIPALYVEDGFIRSWGTGEHFPPLSLVVDEEGIYYDSTCPSALETLLNSDVDVLAEKNDDVIRAKALILEHRLSKYNHAPLLNPDHLPPLTSLPSGGSVIRRVLVIDQTHGDLSIQLGGATSETFSDMLSAARAENPDATIFVKTHPEVSSARKKGYLTDVRVNEKTVVLRQAVNPLSLIEQMDRVYVVTSQMGFEALLAGKPVTCFGLPWYARWGATDDRQQCQRRTRTRSVDELFAAAYFHYARYLNPVTHQQGTIFDVIDWLVLQKKVNGPGSGRVIGVGFRRWKAANIKTLLSLNTGRVHFVKNALAAKRLSPTAGDKLVFWGRTPPEGVEELSDENGASLVRIEDGFVRSVGLGSDLIPPQSLVMDNRGIYFDPGQRSDLEHILNTTSFMPDEIKRAGTIRKFIVEHGITKYNIEPRDSLQLDTGDREVVFVPGQVEDDASIQFGCDGVSTNLGLLKAARQAHPDAFIVYKPHPDVMASNRVGNLKRIDAQVYADHVETGLSVISCIEVADVIHTMTSLAGFDALLRGKKVVVYGRPFYSGWGLTDDRLVIERRQRDLSLDELVAGTLLLYPVYWDSDLKGYTNCEAVLHQIISVRDALEASGGLNKLRVGYLRRQWRKIVVLLKTCVAS